MYTSKRSGLPALHHHLGFDLVKPQPLPICILKMSAHNNTEDTHPEHGMDATAVGTTTTAPPTSSSGASTQGSSSSAAGHTSAAKDRSGDAHDTQRVAGASSSNGNGSARHEPAVMSSRTAFFPVGNGAPPSPPPEPHMPQNTQTIDPGLGAPPYDIGRWRSFSSIVREDCHTCKARGKQCDQNRPMCYNCLRASVRCGGYKRRPDSSEG